MQTNPTSVKMQKQGLLEPLDKQEFTKANR